jgi:hypothetical protein
MTVHHKVAPEPLRSLRPGATTWRDIDGEVIVLDVVTSQYHALNPSAALLWRALADGAAVSDLVAQLVTDFTVDAGVAAVDVSTFLDECAHRHWITW